MNNENVLIIDIMGREFSINCPDEEREEILKAAEFLNSKIQEIKNEGKIVDSERVIIAAALGITHELLALHRSNGFDIDDIKRRITNIRERITAVLNKKRE
ncbi:MAG: cell division protein ZapA [Nitrosomonas sp.]|jgi:cell division protein ZapA|nr:cell division protein ZapA [Nitrosomonas sp.]